MTASSDLLRRRDRAEALLVGAGPWDPIVLDEAHHARRRRPAAPVERDHAERPTAPTSTCTTSALSRLTSKRCVPGSVCSSKWSTSPAAEPRLSTAITGAVPAGADDAQNAAAQPTDRRAIRARHRYGVARAPASMHASALNRSEPAGVLASRATAAAKLAFEFLVLTAARSGEVRLAQWTEIDQPHRGRLPTSSIFPRSPSASSPPVPKLRGALFENAVVAEALKHGYNRRRRPRLFFRDRSGPECDCNRVGGPAMSQGVPMPT